MQLQQIKYLIKDETKTVELPLHDKSVLFSKIDARLKINTTPRCVSHVNTPAPFPQRSWNIIAMKVRQYTRHRFGAVTTSTNWRNNIVPLFRVSEWTPKPLSVIKVFRTGSIFCVFSHPSKAFLTTQSHRTYKRYHPKLRLIN